MNLLHRLKTYRMVYLYHYIKFIFRNNKEFLAREFKKVHGYKIDFNNPKTLNEYIVSSKLTRVIGQGSLFVDKLLVKTTVKSLNKDVNIIETFDEDFCPEDLLDRKIIANLVKKHGGIVFKTNHDSGGVWILDGTNVDSYDFKKMYRQVKHRLNINLYHITLEYPYKNVKPRLFIEKKIEFSAFKDYKFFCFKGVVEFILIYDDNSRCFVDKNGKLLPFKWDKKGSKKECLLIHLPDNFNQMIHVAESLCRDFHFVRVDLYSDHKNIFFGEFTFFPNDGHFIFNPRHYDEYYGEKLKN